MTEKQQKMVNEIKGGIMGVLEWSEREYIRDLNNYQEFDFVNCTRQEAIDFAIGFYAKIKAEISSHSDEFWLTNCKKYRYHEDWCAYVSELIEKQNKLVSGQ